MQGDQDYGLQTLFRDTWQQVCHAGIDLYGHIHTPIRHFGYFTSQCSRYLGSTVGRDSLPMTPTQRYESASSKELAVNGSRLQPNLQPTATPGDSMSTQTPNAAATPAEQSKVAGVGGNTEQMRSSCMAIVIGLVVGIMWF
ncbi:hypothetical protein MW887_006674 [Aspergillus wentii]|nr:hypothetical protein MW887_006674 [Aspergillus wentii]